MTSEETPIVRLEDNLALSTVKKSISYENQMYQVGIPWNCDDPDLPSSYKMALQRLQNTEKRLKRIPEVSKAYSDCIQRYVKKGYVTKVPAAHHSNTKWFLLHFPVLRPDKDTTKTRIVFNAAAKVKGVSLNDKVYQGPKLQRDLFDVLLRFRRYPIAVVSDVEEMYLRIGITESDKPFHRFLWQKWMKVTAQRSTNSIELSLESIHRHSRLSLCCSSMRGSTRALFLWLQKQC